MCTPHALFSHLFLWSCSLFPFSSYHKSASYHPLWNIFSIPTVSTVIYSARGQSIVAVRTYCCMFSCLFSFIRIVFMCVFFVLYIEYFPYCLFVSNSQVIVCEDRLRNDLYCVGWGVKLYSIQSTNMKWIMWIMKTWPFEIFQNRCQPPSWIWSNRK